MTDETMPAARRAGVILAWIWAIFGTLSALRGLVAEDFPFALFLLLSVLVAFPPLSGYLDEHVKLVLPGWMRAVFIVLLVGIALAVMKPLPQAGKQTAHSDGSNTDQAPAAPQLSADLAAFDKANNDAKPAYEAADNELKKSVVRKDRDEAVHDAVQNGAFQDWPGTLERLGPDGDGDAFITVKPDGCECTISTTNNSFSEALSPGKTTLIKMHTPLFDKLSNMHEGDRVRVSGRMFREMSLTEAGSIDDPDWLTRFSDASPLQ